MRLAWLWTLSELTLSAFGFRTPSIQERADMEVSVKGGSLCAGSDYFRSISGAPDFWKLSYAAELHYTVPWRLCSFVCHPSR